MIEDREAAPTPDPVRYEARITRADRLPTGVALILVGFVALAIAKPWGDGAGGFPGDGAGQSPEFARRGSISDVASSGSPAASAPLADPAAVSDLCYEPGSWRTATIETWRDQTVRVWRALDLVAASGPEDPRIRIVPAVGTSVPAIGYCASTVGPDEPTGDADVRAWQRAGSSVREIRLHQSAPVGFVSPYGALFSPPDGATDPGSWPNGVFIFRHTDLATGVARWFGIEVSGTSGERAPPRRAPTTPRP
jgi:hypothetical protein